jgi:hypothetical protein
MSHDCDSMLFAILCLGIEKPKRCAQFLRPRAILQAKN